MHSVATLDRLRRRRGQPVPDARDARASSSTAGELPDGMTAGGGAAPRGQGHRQGPAEDDVEDGHLDDPVLLRRADLRGVGLAPELVERHFTGTPSRIGGIGIETLAEETLARHARAYPGLAGRAAAGRRPLRLAPRRRAPPVEPGDDRAPPARGARRRLRDVRGVLADGQRRQRAHAGRCAGCCRSASREDGGIPLDEVEPAKEIVKRFVDRRDVARLALARGARDARDRDEPPRRHARTPARAARTRRATSATRTATRAARRSSRSPRAASA